MNYRVLYTCICLFCALLIAVLPVTAVLPATASQTMLESPPILKTYIPENPSHDEHFFAQVTEYMEQLSGNILNVRDDFRFFTLLASGYNIEDHATAQQLLDFLFYSAKAGDHYQQAVANKGLFFTPINAENEDLLAKEYRALAEKTFNSCDACQEYYPDFVMYSLPSGGDEEPESAYQFTGKLGF